MFTCRPQVLPEVPDVLDGATVPNQNFERTQAQVFKFKLRSEWYVDIREVNEVNQIILMISFQSFLHLFFHQGTAMRTQYLRTIWPSCGQRVRRRSITRIKFLSLQSGKTIKYVFIYIYQIFEKTLIKLPNLNSQVFPDTASADMCLHAQERIFMCKI